MIGKPKNQRVLKTDTGQFLISIKWKHGLTWKLAGNGSTKSLFQKSKDEQDIPFSYWWIMRWDTLAPSNTTTFA
jgi:hypothetical protein